MKVGIIGTGYVGLTTGVTLAHLGHQVTCLDVDAEKVSLLNRGGCPIYEPHLEDLMASVKGQLGFTTDATEALGHAEVIFISVGTPSGPGGQPNLSYLKSAAESIGRCIQNPFVVIVNKSTVPIGSGNWVESLVRDAYRAENPKKGSDFVVASNPEFLREGSALSDSLYADRVVVGADRPQALDVLRKLYQPLIEQTFIEPKGLPRPEGFTSVPFVATDLQSAELIKYAANAFLALKISFINEISELSEKVGANIRDISYGIGLDSRIGNRFLQAGLGWGGSCFGKDTAALVATGKEYGLPMQLTASAKEVNHRQRHRVIDSLAQELKILKGRKIGLLGLAFKPNTDDLRDAPAIEIANLLCERGAKVVGYDPIANTRARKEWKDHELIITDQVQDVFDEADAVVLVTEWQEFLQLNWGPMVEKMKNHLVIDGRCFLGKKQLGSLNLKLITMGMSR